MVVSFMKNTNRIHQRFRQLFRYWSVIKDKALRKEFFNEIELINFNRLKYFGYFLLAMGAYQLFADFFLSDFWENQQISSFMYLDITVVLAATIILLVSYTNPPRTTSEIRPWHSIYFHIYLFYHLAWATTIAIIEAKTANSVPTFLIGVFAATTIYLLRAIPSLVMLVVSLVGLFAGLKLTGMDTPQLINQYSPTVILVFIAWLVSRVLLNTRMRTFKERKSIELARDNLDQTVKERTQELLTANTKLQEEVKKKQKSQRRLLQEKKKAEEADRLKSVFLANMSHEIRTPLNGIIGFGDLLKNPKLTIEKKDRYVEIIGNNGQQLVKIIDDLMDISMIESNQLKLNLVEFRLSHILPDAEVFFNNYLRINNKEHLSITNGGFTGDGNDTLKSDPARVQQVLYNLLGNAVKFTQKGEIRFGAKLDEGYIMVYVEDTGIGISQEKCRAIFERFRQGEESTSRTYGGTGLGLSISKGIVELLGGMIWIDLSYTEGARFCFALPTVEIKEVLSAKKLEPSIRQLEKKAAIITSVKKYENGFLDYYVHSRKLFLKKIHPFRIGSVSDLPHADTYILDMQKEDPANYEDLIHTILDTGKNLITVSDSNPITIKKLQALGCHLVLDTPVNINLLLAKIKTGLQKGEYTTRV